MKDKTKILREAFPHTLPIMAGFSFLGLAYGVYMNSMGFSFIYPLIFSLAIYTGTMEFITASLLLGAFNPLNAFFLSLMVGARHLFYGISMLEKFNDTGKKKFFLIYGMCDESFSVNCIAEPSTSTNKGWFMFFITLLNYIYWSTASTLGALIGSTIPFDIKGIEFVMTALFIVIFIDQWFSQEEYLPFFIGIGAPALCLIIWGAKNFMLPSMALIVLILTIFRKKLEKKEEVEECCQK